MVKVRKGKRQVLVEICCVFTVRRLRLEIVPGAVDEKVVEARYQSEVCIPHVPMHCASDLREAQRWS